LLKVSRDGAEVISTGSTVMGDYQRAGKLSQYVASHLSRLKLLPSVGW